MFNEYVWKTYLSAGGETLAKFFESSVETDFSSDYAHKVRDFHRVFCPCETINKLLHKELLGLVEDTETDNFFYGCYSVLDLYNAGERSLDKIFETFCNGLKDDNASNDQQIFKEFSGGIEYYTTYLFMLFPDLFVPYYFKSNFNVFEKICEEFEIALPDIPVKKDYWGRLNYYGEICKAILEFRNRWGISSYEFCAFLYDFAPKYIGGYDSYIIKDLPEPKSAFFIGGSQDDMFLEEKTDIITCWQCNPDTRAGDMVVMYLRTPISAVDSVWRSVSVGFNDPFFYYYRCTYIANPVGIKRITQKDLQQDKILGELPIVKKNMQGINGVELLPSQYNYLMDKAEATVPRLEFCISSGDSKFALEKDVENKLIKPLLVKLGYTENDYVQQLYIEIGNRNHALIPDFVIMPHKTKGHYSSKHLIEAKLSIPSLAYLEEVKTQARSYAKLLGVECAVVASKEKLWVTSQSDDYSADVFSASWDELKNADVFTQLLKLIGKSDK